MPKLRNAIKMAPNGSSDVDQTLPICCNIIGHDILGMPNPLRRNQVKVPAGMPKPAKESALCLSISHRLNASSTDSPVTGLKLMCSTVLRCDSSSGDIPKRFVNPHNKTSTPDCCTPFTKFPFWRMSVGTCRAITLAVPPRRWTMQAARKAS